MEDLYEVIQDSGSAILMADPKARIVELLGDDLPLGELERRGLGLFGDWSEERIATNAVALTLMEGQPVATVGAEHYCAALHPLAVAAAPLFNLVGESLGALAVVTFASTYHPHTLGMVASAVQAIHARLQMELLLTEANDHLTELKTAIEAMSEGLVLINADGNLSLMNDRAARILGLSVRAASGRPLRSVVHLPQQLEEAISERRPLEEQELLFPGPHGPIAAVCTLKPIQLANDRYLGSLLTLHSEERVHSLIHNVVGSQAEITFNDLIGESQAIQMALREARVAANGRANVLLVGERGTGKDLFARAIHQASSRANGPFVSLNCAAIPRTLIGKELFGSESISGLRSGRPGKLELAYGGTLFLAEVDALPMECQTNLLRAIETHHLIRQGGQRTVPLDVRIIATTTNGLGVDAGHFRPDLASRLSGFVIEVPPLRMRGDDVLLLIDQMLGVLNQRAGKQIVVSPEALRLLAAYPWPGNVRELETTLEQLVHSVEHAVLQIADLPAHIRYASGRLGNSRHMLRQYHHQAEREAILRAGRAAGGHLGRTAQRLGISRSTLWRKMNEYGVSRDDFWRDVGS